MWELLLVLGQVPGTNYEITFAQVVLFCLMAPLMWLAYRRLLRLNPRKSANLIITYLKTRKGQQLKLSV